MGGEERKGKEMGGEEGEGRVRPPNGNPADATVTDHDISTYIRARSLEGP